MAGFPPTTVLPPGMTPPMAPTPSISKSSKPNAKKGNLASASKKSKPAAAPMAPNMTRSTGPIRKAPRQSMMPQGSMVPMPSPALLENMRQSLKKNTGSFKR